MNNQRSKWLNLTVAFIGLLLFSLACQWSVADVNSDAFSVGDLFGQENQKPTARPTFSSMQAQPVSAKPLVLSAQDQVLTTLYERVNPGVVAIWVISSSGINQGTGFVVDKEGHIVTNFHVVADAAQVEVNFPSDYKAYGKVIAGDPDSDLGVVKVDAPPDKLFPLPMGDSDQVKIGQTVVAFGFSGTMTIGIISGKGRTLTSLRSAPSGDFFTTSDLLQTDAAINPGNSGGPLLNLQGEVVGINRAIQTTNFTNQGEPVNSGIGFAVSINIVKRVLPGLIADGKYDYPYIGLEGLPELTLEAARQLNLPSTSGIYVTRVTPNGPSQTAGILRGDLITAVDGRAVRNFGEMISYFFNYKTPGDTITLTVLRGEDKKDIPVVLEKRP
jgi:S1-C subfamily serine protease